MREPERVALIGGSALIRGNAVLITQNFDETKFIQLILKTTF